MTAEEAIATLKANYPDACYEQLREAVDRAIEALKQPEIIHCKDCKYASGDVYCHCKYANWWNNPYDYCSRAEKRGGEDDETDCDYERAVEQLEHDMLYEPTFDPDDGSM
jgi:hypothetical protein